jgi:drug/metabolite transporter (DMT)-like permease
LFEIHRTKSQSSFLELSVLAFRLGLLAALAAVTSWGAMFTIMSHLLASLDPFWLTSIRYVFAAGILALALLIVEGVQPASRDSTCSCSTVWNAAAPNTARFWRRLRLLWSR